MPKFEEDNFDNSKVLNQDNPTDTQNKTEEASQDNPTNTQNKTEEASKEEATSFASVLQHRLVSSLESAGLSIITSFTSFLQMLEGVFSVIRELGTSPDSIAKKAKEDPKFGQAILECRKYVSNLELFGKSLEDEIANHFTYGEGRNEIAGPYRASCFLDKMDNEKKEKLGEIIHILASACETEEEARELAESWQYDFFPATSGDANDHLKSILTVMITNAEALWPHLNEKE